MPRSTSLVAIVAGGMLVWPWNSQDGCVWPTALLIVGDKYPERGSLWNSQVGCVWPTALLVVGDMYPERGIL